MFIFLYDEIIIYILYCQHPMKKYFFDLKILSFLYILNLHRGDQL